MENQLVVVIIFLSLASLIHGIAGVGYGLISVVIFTIFFNGMEEITALISLVGIVVFVGLYFTSKNKSRKIDWCKVLVISLGGIIGTLIGYKFVLLFYSKSVIKIIIGIIILMLALISIYQNKVKMSLRDNGWLAILIGIFSGFIATAFIAGGPPIALYLYSQGKKPLEMKGTIQMTFIILGLFRIIVLGVGRVGYNWDILRITFISIIPVIVALYWGNYLSGKFKESVLRMIVYCLIGVCGVIVAVLGGINVI